MQMHEAKEVVQVVGAADANAKLAEGWTLLAVTGAGNGSEGGQSFVWYVLGRKAQKKPLDISAAALAKANRGL